MLWLSPHSHSTRIAVAAAEDTVGEGPHCHRCSRRHCRLPTAAVVVIGIVGTFAADDTCTADGRASAAAAGHRRW